MQDLEKAYMAEPVPGTYIEPVAAPVGKDGDTIDFDYSPGYSPEIDQNDETNSLEGQSHPDGFGNGGENGCALGTLLVFIVSCLWNQSKSCPHT